MCCMHAVYVSNRRRGRTNYFPMRFHRQLSMNGQNYYRNPVKTLTRLESELNPNSNKNIAFAAHRRTRGVTGPVGHVSMYTVITYYV